MHIWPKSKHERREWDCSSRVRNWNLMLSVWIGILCDTSAALSSHIACGGNRKQVTSALRYKKQGLVQWCCMCTTTEETNALACVFYTRCPPCCKLSKKNGGTGGILLLQYCGDRCVHEQLKHKVQRCCIKVLTSTMTCMSEIIYNKRKKKTVHNSFIYTMSHTHKETRLHAQWINYISKVSTCDTFQMGVFIQ